MNADRLADSSHFVHAFALAVYDGRDWGGSINKFVRDHRVAFVAVDPAGALVGRFPTQNDAAAALMQLRGRRASPRSAPDG
jgi:hypothetical protein